MNHRKRIVDLSHDMWPGKEEYGLDVETHQIDEVYPQYRRRPDVWYTLQTVHMSCHIGTHIEFPRHFDPEGLDSASYPLERLIGPACVLDFRSKKDNEPITIADIRKYEELIEDGDIVFLRTGRHVKHNKPGGHERPYLTPDATRWLVENKDISAIGVDATGIEVKGTDYHPVHSILLKEHGRALIEGVGDLGQLRCTRFEVWILPLKIHGLEASPIRLLAVEDEGGSL